MFLRGESTCESVSLSHGIRLEIEKWGVIGRKKLIFGGDRSRVRFRMDRE
jgi:hypothetical protein